MTDPYLGLMRPSEQFLQASCGPRTLKLPPMLPSSQFEFETPDLGDRGPLPPRSGVSNSNWLRGRIRLIQGFAGRMKTFLELLGPHQTSRSDRLINISAIIAYNGYQYS